jgi:hypothetical protein
MTLTDLLANLESPAPDLDNLAVAGAIGERLATPLGSALRLTYSWDAQMNFMIERFPADRSVNITTRGAGATALIVMDGISVRGEGRDTRMALLTAILRADRDLKFRKAPR